MTTESPGGPETGETLYTPVGLWTRIPGTDVEIGLARHDQVPLHDPGQPWPIRWRRAPGTSPQIAQDGSTMPSDD